jgi:hypothetical protein
MRRSGLGVVNVANLKAFKCFVGLGTKERWLPRGSSERMRERKDGSEKFGMVEADIERETRR